MVRRLLPTLLVLGAGFAALTAFLVVLELVFVAEDERGARQEAQNRLALETYATLTLQRMVRDDWTDAAERIERVQADPLLDAAGLVLLSDGRQLLPRVPDEEHGVKERFAGLVAGRLAPDEAGARDDDDPWSVRVAHLETLRAALAKRDRSGIEGETRFLLQHRTRWVLAPARDLPLTLAMLELLATRSTPSAQLSRAVLRDGLGGEAPMEGLERQVLRAWTSLGADDVAFLCAEVARQAERAGVVSDDFSARCSQRGERLALPELNPGHWLVPSAHLVVRAASGEVRGGVVDVALRLAQLTTEMQIRGLLEAGDALAFDADTGELVERAALPAEDVSGPGRVARPPRAVALKNVGVVVRAPRFELAARERREAFRLKTALVVTTFLLGAAIVAVAVIAQRRKHRFLELKSDFVSTVSHELRTPLASLRLMAETLERKVEGFAPAKDYPQRIVGEVDGLSTLVENILSFNRIDKGRWAPRLAPWRMAEVEPLLREDAQRYTAAKVEVSFAGLEGVTLTADAELMRLLFQNLLRNACKYNERDPVRFSVEASLRGRAVVVRVSDNGVGIPGEQQEAVFEAFHRLQGRGRGGGGSGLGLALCRKIARLHRGTLRVERSSADGTVFELVLPA